jgi:long-chain fatty acid transport protein
MKRHSAVQQVLAILVLGAFVLSPAPALASGFQLVEQNASGLGNAYAGQVAGAKDASAVYFNPANLTRIPGKQFVLSVSPIGIKTEFGDTGSTRPFLPSNPPTTIPVPLGTNGGDAGGWVPVPNGYVSWQAGSKWWLGLGVNAPFGLKTEWDPDFVGRFKAITSEVRTLNLNPAVAVKLSDSFSLGAGVSYQRLKATLSQSVAYGGITLGAASQVAAATGNPAVIPGMLAQIGGPAGLALEGVSQVEGDTWSWGWNAGAALAIGKEGHLAASYRSRIKHDVEGDVAFGGAPVFTTAGPLGGLGTALNGRFASGPVTTQIELPETVSVGASYEGERFEVLGDWTWTGWSSIQDLAIQRADGSALSSAPLNFQDTWRAGLGLNYALSPAWTLRLGTAYDKAPVQDRYRTPRLPDQDRTWAAVGFQYKVGKSGAIDFGYAHLFVKDATSDLPNQDSAGSAPSGNLVGGYTAGVNILSIQFRRSF